MFSQGLAHLLLPLLFPWSTSAVSPNPPPWAGKGIPGSVICDWRKRQWVVSRSPPALYIIFQLFIIELKSSVSTASLGLITWPKDSCPAGLWPSSPFSARLCACVMRWGNLYREVELSSSSYLQTKSEFLLTFGAQQTPGWAVCAGMWHSCPEPSFQEQELLYGIVGPGGEVRKSLKLAWESDLAIVLFTTQSQWVIPDCTGSPSKAGREGQEEMAAASCSPGDQSSGHGLTARVNDDDFRTSEANEWGLRSHRPAWTEGSRTFLGWTGHCLIMMISASQSLQESKTFTFYKLQGRKADRASICFQMREHF